MSASHAFSDIKRCWTCARPVTPSGLRRSLIFWCCVSKAGSSDCRHPRCGRVSRAEVLSLQLRWRSEGDGVEEPRLGFEPAFGVFERVENFDISLCPENSVHAGGVVLDGSTHHKGTLGLVGKGIDFVG
jgi:hypothetical protein